MWSAPVHAGVKPCTLRPPPQSLAAGRLVTLPAITSVAKSLGAATPSAAALHAALRPAGGEPAVGWPEAAVHPVVVSDTDAVSACLRFADDHRLLVEPACGAALAPIYGAAAAGSSLCAPLAQAAACGASGAGVVAIVCGGAAVDRASLAALAHQLGLSDEALVASQ